MEIILDARLHLGYAKHAIVHAKAASAQPGSYLTTQGLDAGDSAFCTLPSSVDRPAGTRRSSRLKTSLAKNQGGAEASLGALK
jgi:hypothetical protein